jgi:hypothetical protein
MLSLLVTILVLCIVGGLLFWLIGYLPILPPFKTAAYVILVIIIIVALLYLVFGGGNWGDLGFHRRY